MTVALLFGQMAFAALPRIDPVQQEPAEGESENFHAQLDVLEGPFESGPEVTAACLSCHEGAAEQIMATSHWTWEYEHPVLEETVGKVNVINNYCVSVRENEPRCTSCHVGYGWADDSFDFTDETAVDCLVCHDTTGTYKKFPPGAGNPVLGEARQFSGKTWEPVDLALVAQNVGETSRETCGSCHFTGGGGDGVKHGDLDATMLDANFTLDVHMDSSGLDMSCTDCHVTEGHVIPGGRYVMDWATADPTSTCESCHTTYPHEGAQAAELNSHADIIACQTCHIPEFARGEPTMMYWDWSTAGQKNEDGGLLITSEEINGHEVHTYDTRKGSFEWAMFVEPTYLWSNGIFDYALIEDGVDPAEGYVVNEVLGDINDERSKIWPFKEFRGLQPYDSGNNLIATVNLFPSGEETAAFWRSYDWDQAIETGMAAYGQEYSGEYGYIESVMYWPITHQVAPAGQALDCLDCHDDDGRMDFIALGYQPEDVLRLTSFPPVTQAGVDALAEAEATAEAAEAEAAAALEEAVATAQAEGYEAGLAEAQVAPEPAPEPSSGPTTIVWVVGLLALAVGFGAGFFVMQQRRAS